MKQEKAPVPVRNEYTTHGPEGAVLTTERIGSNPNILFVSGIHGDEWQIIAPLRKVLDELTDANPTLYGSHVRIMESHPEAIRNRSRNGRVKDLNRQFAFRALPEDPQAKLVAESFLENPDVHTVFSFHEDPEEDRFYFYYQAARDDRGEQDGLINSLRAALLTTVTGMGIPLYNGLDDVELGYLVEQGFCLVAPDAMHDNSLEMWVLQKELHKHPNIKRSFLFEIPGKLSADRKEELIRVIFDEFIGPFLTSQPFPDRQRPVRADRGEYSGTEKAVANIR